MKNILSLLTLSLLLTLWSCGPAQPAEEATTEETTTEEAAQETAAVMSGENYAITIVKDSIASPRKEMKGTVGGAAVTVNYGSPSVKGRTIWGDLVQFNDVWRTGANETTTIEFAADVMVEGQELAAGKYGLYTYPTAESVIVIFSKKTEGWGTGDYSEADDALRVTVTPNAVETNAETLDFVVEGDAVVLQWANWKIPFGVSAK
ncbi:MAG: DUF2911 domain-containing protein [Saprospiraceae bacterium]|nr:DUF2911 domain-containing protein [Saprospiraceae bacterium]